VRGFGTVCLGIVIALWAGAVPAAAQSDARLKQAAQHFAELEDDQAKAILKELSGEGVADADVLLGYLYSDPLYDGRDYESAVAAFRAAASGGSEEALFQVAESRFWPDSSAWTLSPFEESIRPSLREVLELLQRVVGEDENPFQGNNAAKWRFAWLCTFSDYDCGDSSTDKALQVGTRFGYGNLRTIKGAFHILELLHSGEADGSTSRKEFDPYLSLGYADADPFVTEAVTALVWRDVSTASDCPALDGFTAKGRFLAAQNGVSQKYDNRLDLEDCYDAEQLKALKADLVGTLDYLARGFGNSGSWHLRRCYMEAESEGFGDCLIHAVRHHYFACTKLSIPKYFDKRFGIEYRTSKRYEQCREMMLGYPPLHNRI
jgi:hypothetical protein